MKEFMHEHPWMTFFLGLAAIQGATVIVTSMTGSKRARIPPPIPHKPVSLSHAPQGQLPGAGGGHYTGAVNRGGFKGGAGMPFGPGPWPTSYASENPQEAWWE